MLRRLSEENSNCSLPPPDIQLKISTLIFNTQLLRNPSKILDLVNHRPRNPAPKEQILWILAKIDWFWNTVPEYSSETAAIPKFSMYYWCSISQVHPAPNQLSQNLLKIEFFKKHKNTFFLYNVLVQIALQLNVSFWYFWEKQQRNLSCSSALLILQLL